MKKISITDYVETYVKQPLWDNWYLKEEIGSGTFGAVFLAEAEFPNRVEQAAVKATLISPPVQIKNKEDKQRYIDKQIKEQAKEADRMAKLRSCPYIVDCYDERYIKFPSKEEPEGCIHLIRMPLLQNVYDIIVNGQFDLSEKNLLKFALDIGKGIKACHDSPILHRDIKPQNIFYSQESGNYILGDFGISKDASLAMTYAGTPMYMAPEILNGSPYDTIADIYSFGLTLYDIMNDLAYPRIIGEDGFPVPIDGTVPLPKPVNAADDFFKIILKASAFNTADRYDTMDKMLADLEKLAAKETLHVQQKTPSAPPQEIYANNYKPAALPNKRTDNTQAAEEKSENEDHIRTLEPVIKRTDFETDLKAAERGDIAAQCRIGDRYYSEENYVQAVNRYRRAAESRYIDSQWQTNAQWKLGRCYLNGKGIKKDEFEAVKWFKKAAEKNCPEGPLKWIPIDVDFTNRTLLIISETPFEMPYNDEYTPVT